MTAKNQITPPEAIALATPFVGAYTKHPYPALSIHTCYGWNVWGAWVIGVDADGIKVADHYDGKETLFPWDEIDSLRVRGGGDERHYLLIDETTRPAEATIPQVAA